MSILASDIPSQFRQFYPNKPPKHRHFRQNRQLIMTKLPKTANAFVGLFFLCVFVVKEKYLYCNDSSSTAICAAADTREPSAAFAPIQRLAPSYPPTQNVNSAPCSLKSARHFSGFKANYANGDGYAVGARYILPIAFGV